MNENGSTVSQAYERCVAITRAEAGNFYYGIRLLPPHKRDALCAVYALARRIDDIGDGDMPPADKLQALDDVRTALGEIDASTDPVYVAVSDTTRRLPVPLDAFGELVDGVRMDVGDVHIASFDELVVYCRYVAGAVGRLCTSVFGSTVDDPRIWQFADQLGIALQQTNILRDIREDLGNDRVYLPEDELAAFGVKLGLDDSGDLEDTDGRLAAYIRYAAARADDWYSLGSRLLPYLDRRSAACCRAMSGIYRRLLHQIAREPACVYDRRLSLPATQKAGVALAALAHR